jgi:hypothetical protein
MEMLPRLHLSSSGLLNQIRSTFLKIPDHRSELLSIPLADALMSGLAVFGLKYPSLLKFDSESGEKVVRHNLQTLYGVNKIPSDTQMREILDEVDPNDLRVAYKKIFSTIQRGNVLKSYRYLDEYYLISVDGTGQLSSEKVHCDQCCEKTSRNGKTTYYHQLVGAVVVHPDKKLVIPLAPEPITKQDGDTKNDCERNASKRLLEHLRREHPHLKVIIIEDSLASNAPHIKLLKKLDMRFILGAKPGDHKFLFNKVEEYVQSGNFKEHEITKEDSKTHKFRFINAVPLNKDNSDVLVNFLEYWEVGPKKTLHFTWVTDFFLSNDNVFEVMKGGRARWKVENETFNALKNQGYNFEHNYGHGKKNLATIFMLLMMLAFLVDQTLEISCSLFQASRKKLVSRTSLWERMRSLFLNFLIDSWDDMFIVLSTGPPGHNLRQKKAKDP